MSAYAIWLARLKYKLPIVLGLLLLGFVSLYILSEIYLRNYTSYERWLAQPISFLAPVLFRSTLEPIVWFAVIAVSYWPFKSRKEATNILVVDSIVLLTMFLVLCACGGFTTMLLMALLAQLVGTIAPSYRLVSTLEGCAFSYVGGTVLSLGAALLANWILLRLSRK